MTTSQELQLRMHEFLGGSDGRTRHPFNRRLIYTEGVKAVADLAGAHWLLDIVATEVAPISLRMWDKDEESMTFFNVKVDANKQADLWLNRDSNLPKLWQRHISYTDFPEGDWIFYLCMDGLIDPKGDVLVMLLPQEY